ncbi:hypothetical protein SmJEL517_g05635 [Synchytrium microbalum]|uniref:Uncharacterized protein n=1 Tax=Synchytrium microbalum TaxID=1806994 RepID=A0A507BUG5_9FUNG|nr:uncharacterized protein SmJEL517_g05635 [Synchytrium microbalum]TPX30861.1 hypothetical protein SmJEL517_g05635 [Synchytrium microbalum]
MRSADKGTGDNLLLEWEVAQELVKLGKTVLLPLLVGRADELTGALYQFQDFPDPDFSQFPDKKHPHPLSTTNRTIRDTIKAVFALQGTQVLPTQLGSVIPTVTASLQRLEESFAPSWMERGESYKDPASSSAPRRPGYRSSQVLTGHTDAVWGVVFADTGSKRIIASETMTLRAHTGGVLCVASSPRLPLLASAAADCTVCLWNTDNGALLSSIKEHKSWVNAVAFAPNGTIFASAGGLPLTPCKNYKTYLIVEIWMLTLSLDPNRFNWEPKTGQVLASPSPDDMDYSIKFWNGNTGTALRGALRGHENGVLSIAFSPDSNTLVSGGSWDKLIKLWDLRQAGREIANLAGHANWVNGVAFGPAGSSCIASGSGDSTVRIWDLRTCSETKRLVGHTSFISSIAFPDNDAELLVSSSYDGSLRTWNWKTGEPIQSLFEHQGPVLTVATRADGDVVVSGSEDHSLHVWRR